MTRKFMPWYVYVCEVFGLGQLPVAPGTWGSLGGVLLYAAAYPYLSPWLLGLITVLVLIGSIPLCNWASLYMARQDPQNVVLDEVVGQWITLFPLFWAPVWPESIGLGFVAGFFAFRFFDVLNVFPVNLIEGLEGGWGIVLDDVMAGLYGNATLILLSYYLAGESL